MAEWKKRMSARAVSVRAEARGTHRRPLGDQKLSLLVVGIHFHIGEKWIPGNAGRDSGLSKVPSSRSKVGTGHDVGRGYEVGTGLICAWEEPSPPPSPGGPGEGASRTGRDTRDTLVYRA